MFVRWICSLLFSASLATAAVASCPAGFFEDGVRGTAQEYLETPKFSLNHDGILVHDYGSSYGGLGKWANPFFISRYANTFYADWYRGGCTDDSIRDAFLNQANWLLDNAEKRDGMAVWTYPFDNENFGAAAGFISGISQSHIASVLYRAYAITGDDQFRTTSASAMEVYLRPMEQGGVVYDGDGGIWIQEQPDPNGVPFNILNGHVTGLLGVRDYANLTGDDKFEHVLNLGIEAVRSKLHYFDAGFTSFYAMRAPEGERVLLAPVFGYHLVHISQLKRLYELDGDPLFLTMAGRFQSYVDFEYDRSAAGSSVETHAPEHAAPQSTSYWSHRQFPTWYQVDFEPGTVLDGVFLRGQSLAAAPRDFSLMVKIEGEWVEAFASDSSDDQEVFLRFTRPVSADAIRLDIRADNGNRNVALAIVVPILALEGTGQTTELKAVAETLSPGFRLGQEADSRQ